MSLRRSRKTTHIPAAQNATSASASSSPSARPSALNSVVSSLMRAAIGGVPSTVSDDELQRYIADKVLEDAAKSNARYSARNTATRWQSPSLTAQPKNILKPNKRFLAAVIRSTDSHNDALLKKEAVEAEQRLYTLGKDDAQSEENGDGSSPGRREQRSQRSSSRSRTSPKAVSRSPRASDRHHKTRRRRRDASSSPSRSPPRFKGTPSRRELRLPEKKDLDAGRAARTPRASDLPTESDNDDDHIEADNHRWSPRDSRSSRHGSHSRSASHLDGREPAVTKEAKAGRQSEPSSPAPPLSSKRGRGTTGSSRMDRYFEEGYDPSLDMDNYGDELDAYVDRIEELRASKLKASSSKTMSSSQSKKEIKEHERKERKSARRKERERKWISGSSKKRKADDAGQDEKSDSDPSAKKLVTGPRLPAGCPW
ncbi:hypothetical protein HDU87_005066 [Geranomyces variabilis]|uniref:Uncharacterized protein n=1 Tax=Geranomyces variabilis TaxID=109894 RepID=A0AAD5XQD1_9FUNG|nr:hypothetical protein HDU87_005066 [Geranomyces variabilis]